MLDALAVNGRALPGLDRPTGHLVLPHAALQVGANRVDAQFATPIAAAGAAIGRV